MMETRFKIVYTDEAYEFIQSLPAKVQDKIAYNIFKSRVVIDKELFKKLDGTDIWEFRTVKFHIFCFLSLKYFLLISSALSISLDGVFCVFLTKP